jgi:hypothetical protein
MLKARWEPERTSGAARAANGAEAPRCPSCAMLAQTALGVRYLLSGYFAVSVQVWVAPALQAFWSTVDADSPVPSSSARFVPTLTML